MTTYIPPKKNTQFIFYISLGSQTSPFTMQSNPTIAAGDFKVSIDGGSLNNLGTLPAVTPASSKMVKITLSTSEMNGDNITVICSDAAGAEWNDVVINIHTAAQQIDDLETQATGTAIKAKTDNLPSDPADASDLAALLATIAGYIDTEVATIVTLTTAIKAKTDNLPSDPADDSDIDTQLAAINTLAGTINTLSAAVKAKTDQLTFTIPGQVDANTPGSGPLGPGSTPWVITINVSGNPVDGVDVWITTDAPGTNVIARGNTDDLGMITFLLDAGDYYAWKQLAGYSFTNPEAFEVT